MENVNLQSLVEKLGADYPIDRVRMRLRCNACQQRTGGVRIVYVGPGGKAASFRYAR